MPPRDPPFQSRYSHDFSATYLENLRNHRPARPTGSRPAPFSSRSYASLASQYSLARSDSAPTICTNTGDVEEEKSDVSNSKKSVSFTSSLKGRPLAQPPTNEGSQVRGRKVSPTATVQPSHSHGPRVYAESEARKLEKEEAHSLREALERIDQKDEKRIYEAAKDEAADLVWKHLNPKAADEEKVAAYRNPDIKPKERRRSSGPRQISGTRKVSFPSEDNMIYEEPETVEETPKATIQSPSSELPLRAKSRNKLPWLRAKAASDPSEIPTQKKFNQFEIQKNPPTQSRKADYTAYTPPRPLAIETIEEMDTPNSRGSLEIRSEDIRAATSMKRKDRSPNLPTPTAVSDQVGRAIVSFNPDWKPPSDSSRNSQDYDRPVIKLTELPSPVKANRRPLPRPMPVTPEISVSAPSVPTINLPGDIPSSPRLLPEVTMSAPAVPTINLPEEPSTSRPMPALPIINLPVDEPEVPTINVPSQANHAPSHPPRPLPRHSATAPPQSMNTVVKSPSTLLPWLNSRPAIPTVSCSSCALPISGRIVTASGSNSQRDLKARFHPQCFTCNHCDTALECVSFYPEPDASRLIRLGIPAEADQPLNPDDALLLQNDPLRFFCHLDFHEFFSPRCRSCKTPIEGEIVVACGHSYHVDHFFCAECGDPFSSNTPFVEGSDGYAYCVRCHTKRTSARCRACKAQILDEVTVEALGGKWHELCFVCLECGGGFGEEGRFFVREIQVTPSEKELRRGVSSKVEERAVCGGCEERRLKA